MNNVLNKMEERRKFPRGQTKQYGQYSLKGKGKGAGKIPALLSIFCATN
jgi:hypothetical protein